MIRDTTLAAAALGLMCLQPTAPASAQSMGMAHPAMGAMADMHTMHGGGGAMLMLLRSAHLTPAQESQVRQIIASARPQMQTLHAQMEALHQQIADKLLAPGQVGAADVRPLVQKMTGIEAELTESMTTTAIAIRNVLTAEQLTQLTKLHKKLQGLHSQIRNLLGPGADMQDSGD